MKTHTVRWTETARDDLEAKKPAVRETRRQTEKTNLNLRYRKKPVY
ncbi:MAG: hypothetical protein WCH07_02145 [Deltaproteobacteria bacterium]